MPVNYAKEYLMFVQTGVVFLPFHVRVKNGRHYSNFEKNQEKPLWYEKKMANPVKIKDGYRHLNSFVFYTHIYWGENESWLKFLLKIVEQQRLINK